MKTRLFGEMELLHIRRHDKLPVAVVEKAEIMNEIKLFKRIKELEEENASFRNGDLPPETLKKLEDRRALDEHLAYAQGFCEAYGQVYNEKEEIKRFYEPDPDDEVRF